jgi:hypothetical protein
MESLCFLFECLSLSEKRKRTFEYEDEGILHRSPKRLRLAKSSELNIVGLQSREETIRTKNSGNRPTKVDSGISPLLRGNAMEVEEDVTANVRNLPRNKSNNRQRLNNIHQLTPASVAISKNRLKNNLSTGHPGKGQQQTHQPDRGINRLKNLVPSKHGRIVDLTGSKPNVTAVKISNVTPKPMMANKRNVNAEEAEDSRSHLLDTKKRRTVQTSRSTAKFGQADVIPSVSRSLDLTTTSRRSNTILSEQTPSAHRRIIAPNRRLMNLPTL